MEPHETNRRIMMRWEISLHIALSQHIPGRPINSAAFCAAHILKIKKTGPYGTPG
jgi:hypothetical protein